MLKAALRSTAQKRPKPLTPNIACFSLMADTPYSICCLLICAMLARWRVCSPCQRFRARQAPRLPRHAKHVPFLSLFAEARLPPDDARFSLFYRLPCHFVTPDVVSVHVSAHYIARLPACLPPYRPPAPSDVILMLQITRRLPSSRSPP